MNLEEKIKGALHILLHKELITFNSDVLHIKQLLQNNFSVELSEKIIISNLKDIWDFQKESEEILMIPDDYFQGF